MMPTMEEVDEMAAALGDVLRGKGALLQGAGLADAVSRFFTGYHPSLREAAIEEWITTVRNLIPIQHAEMLRRFGPDPWGQGQDQDG